MCFCTQYDSHCGHSWVSMSTPCAPHRDFLNCSSRQIVQLCIAPSGTCPQCFTGFANAETVEMISGPWGCNQMIRGHLGEAQVIPGNWGNANLQPHHWDQGQLMVPGNWGAQPMMGNGLVDQRLIGPVFDDGGYVDFCGNRRRRHKRDEKHVCKYKYRVNDGPGCVIM